MYKMLYILLLFLSSSALCQIIPFGQSTEIMAMQNGGYNWTIGYYKPQSYDSINSEIILYCHGSGGDENEGYSYLHEIADKRGALIVSPTDLTAPWAIARSGNKWLPELFNILYNHILIRETRAFINIRLTGFSAGGQCVTRYMLIRQGINDFIPVKMAISINPYFYTFSTDSLNGIPCYWPSGINITDALYFMGSHCDEHVKGYYNENYSVFIGTADTLPAPGYTCIDSQGVNRYERAVNFYAFSYQDAIERGTSLQWYYAEVPGVGHNGYAMINTKANPEDTVTILEHYLFDMPYHEPQKFPPTADFDYFINDTTQCVEFGADCKCWWQIQPTTYLWYFSNGDTASGQNISVDIPENGQYEVQLIASNMYGSDSIVKNIEISGLPEAIFTVSDIVVTVDSSVYFTNQSLNADSVIWNFGDGQTSDAGDPSHIYQDTGFYTVSLVVFNSDGCTDSASALIEVVDFNYISITDTKEMVLSVFPNPATSHINVNFRTDSEDNIKIVLYDLYNRQVAELFNNRVEPQQEYSLNYDAKGLQSGVYYVVFDAWKDKQARKLIILR